MCLSNVKDVSNIRPKRPLLRVLGLIENFQLDCLSKKQTCENGILWSSRMNHFFSAALNNNGHFFLFILIKVKSLDGTSQFFDI